MKIEVLQSLYLKHKERSLFGRYIHSKHIEPLLANLPKPFKVDVIGQSVNSQNIYSVTIGFGEKKVLMWSQMHGNESTTTKAIFDLLNTLQSDSEVSKAILSHFTLVIIPILNPDGAEMYTRLNANLVDLNRDAQQQSQPESRVLKDCFDTLKPNYCFNLHGQRTLFSAGAYNKVATLSFLSPAQNETRTVTDTRAKAMAIIAKIAKSLHREIPGQIGIYDDSFNINCVGDAFQSLNVPTILFEAGHYKDDYNREEVRRLVYQSFVIALQATLISDFKTKDVQDYYKIPKNDKLFSDILITNVRFDNVFKDVAIQYEEQLLGDTIDFIPKVIKIEKAISGFGHKTINANGNSVLSTNNRGLEVGMIVNTVLINNEVLSLKLGNN